MTVIYNMSIDRADKPWIGDRRFTETTAVVVVVERDFIILQTNGSNGLSLHLFGALVVVSAPGLN